jgi:hypothetical protein
MARNPIIELDPIELAIAAQVGIYRQIESIQEGRRPHVPWFVAGQAFGSHAVGSISEYVVCRYYGLNWRAERNRFHDDEPGDLELWGRSVEIRTTLPGKRLKIAQNDKAEIVFGVWEHSNDLPWRYELFGWCELEEGREIGVWEDPGDRKKFAYWVRADQLHHVDELRPVTRLTEEEAFGLGA